MNLQEGHSGCLLHDVLTRQGRFDVGEKRCPVRRREYDFCDRARSSVVRGHGVLVAIKSREKGVIRMIRTAILGALLCLSAIAAGCNTMAGAGKDIQAGGEALESSAEKSK